VIIPNIVTIIECVCRSLPFLGGLFAARMQQFPKHISGMDSFFLPPEAEEGLPHNRD
jgi:hypothetical protein